MQTGPTTRTPSSERRAPSALIPYIVLAAGLLLTFVAGRFVQRATDTREQLRFANEVQHAGRSIQDRLDIYISLLRATAGLFAAEPNVDAAAFHRYTERLLLQSEYAGIQGVGYTAKLDPRDADAFVTRMRRQGQTSFGLWQTGPSPEYHAIAYLEPLDRRNRQALGYDMFSEPTRRAAMEKARDTGLASASGVVKLVQEYSNDPHPQHGFLIYVPVYRRLLPATASVEERRAALVGFAYSPFRMRDLLKGVFPEGIPSPHIRYDIYDSDIQTPEHLLYRSDAPAGHPPRYKDSVSIEAGARRWTAVFATEPGFDSSAARGVVPFTFAGGALFSALIFGVLLFQVRSREAAERSAAALRKSIAAREAAEQQVRESEDQLRRLYEEAREARAEAEEANRLKDEFLATVSHELRTPLNAIMGYSQLLGMGGRSPEQMQHALQAIERNVKAQAQLINDLLDVSRIISGKLRLEMQIVDPAAVVRNAVEAVTPEAAAKGVGLSVDTAPDTGTVRADPGRLQQVVWNLLSNAIKFTPQDGHVAVRVHPVDGRAEITVSDTGKGIAPEALAHIFDRFRQADSSTTRRYGGLGLGLSIVRQIVGMHGGVARAESKGEGQGATFTVSLPLAAGEGETPALASDGREAPGGSLTGLNILVVDDDLDARTLLREILEDAGARVRVAASAPQALAAVREQPPDVLISDIGMPGEDGYTLIRRVRSLSPERGGAVPAVALTAFARAEDRRKALDAGFQRHATKPIEPRALITLVAALASGQSGA